MVFLCALSIGCSSAPPVPKDKGIPPSSVHTAAKEISFPYETLKEDVLIQLDEEPRLHSPINTVVASSPQAYTLFFRQPMNTGSVEKSIKANAEGKEQNRQTPTNPSFTFEWASDRQLHLKVNVPPVSEPDYGQRRYFIDVTGAKTKAGKALLEPPHFLAVVYTPSQLWQISADGKQLEQLTTFEQPYFFHTEENLDKRYLMLTRFTQYCACDATYSKLYALYDLEQRKLIPYPIELTTNYWGEGEFIVDTRGFFYSKPEPGVAVPESQTAKPIKIGGFVHGASFSKDRTRLLLAAGSKEQKGDYDLIIYDLATNQQKRYPKALQGEVPYNELTGQEAGVRFYDTGKYVTFAMNRPDKYEELRYQYNWQSEKITKWMPPIPIHTWSGYFTSDDGVYQIYANGGLYKGEQLISDDLNYGDNMWLGSTHKLVFTISPERVSNQFKKEGLYLYDLDTQEVKRIADTTGRLLGTSVNGKWIYLEANTPVRK